MDVYQAVEKTHEPQARGGGRAAACMLLRGPFPAKKRLSVLRLIRRDAEAFPLDLFLGFLQRPLAVH
jgi:hypothetical protein